MTKQNKPSVLFVLSVDTEEEWDWKTEFPQHNVQVENIQAIEGFQRECNSIGIRPTYFVDYPVVNNSQSVEVLKFIDQAGQCEIGAHLHPWCNPPMTAENDEFASHVVNLPIDLVEQKLVNLLGKLRTSFEKDICSFRTGRWGINSAVMGLLIKHGITIDSSIYPFYRNNYFNCDGAPVEPYWPDLSNPLKAQLQNQQSSIFEIPVSAGFNHAHFTLCDKVNNLSNTRLLSFLRMPGIMWQLKLLRKIYLSPELSSATDMQTLIKVLLKRKAPIIHMNLHSSSLISLPYNNHPFTREQMLENMKQTVSYLQEHANVTFCTLSEAKEILTQHQGIQ
ncbi:MULTISPECIES: polysaccharide deacetylase family protein [Colwellia]|uniref:Deacetylase n=1 Tax=Colwellia marinimaniae TaxID=1513592 RepID=A0ABQ0MT44_9GAMM|nr:MULTISPECIES: polysaccharide deacetylase family protein [Colwellia]GAW95522.1 deacetylase [Colwellia marinimaniae]